VLTDGITFLLKGGPVMWPLFLCAVASVAVMIERFIALRSALRGSAGLTHQVRGALMEGRERAALSLLDMRPGPVAKVLAVAVRNRTLDRRRIEHLLEEVALRETPALSRGLNVLDTIVTVAPLLGLLGTVTGMIKAFQVVALASGMSAPSRITGGVAEALIATATGLAIAIVTLVGYNMLTEQVRTIVSEMEVAATQIVNDVEGLGGAAESPAPARATGQVYEAAAV